MRSTVDAAVPARSLTASDVQVNAMRYAVVIEKVGSNFSAYVPDLFGCVATGANQAEAKVAIREAIDFHLVGMREDGTPIPPPLIRVGYVEVAA
jgi:predicted RNase H-like HicB family nuclease